MTYRLKRIGIIRTPYTESAPYQPIEDDEGEFRIILDPEYAEGLRDLEGFRYIYVLYYMHQLKRSVSMTVCPPWAGGKKVSLFASRSPVRPNPIGLSIVRLKGIADNVILTSGLDVFDGTPLLDIKPYIKDLDSKSDANKGWIEKIKGVSSVEIEKKIKSLGLELPEVPKPVASYVPAVHSGSYVFTSGQLPFIKGELKARGKIGSDLTVEEGYECAKVAALNCLAAVKSVVGAMDRVRRVIRVTGFINSAPGFEEQSKVMNGASDLLVEIFGEEGKHSRLAIGTSELPLGTPVEVEMIVEVQ